MPIPEQISDLHKRLASRQWDEIQNHGKRYAEGFQERSTKREQTGINIFQTAINTSGITAEDFNRGTFAVKSDPRFRFLGRLPSIAMMYSALGVAFQDSCFKGSVSDVSTTAALNGISARMLDSLIDDIPKLIAPERETLYRLLGKQGWLEPVIHPSDEELEIKHPAVSLLYKLIRGWVTTIKNAPYWQHELSSIREDFSWAVDAALTTEYDTIDCILPSNSQDFDTNSRIILTAKSRNTFWIPALTPALFLDWPEGFDKIAYKACVQRLGDLLGWLDDMSDLVEDIDKGEANEVLIDLYENAGRPSYTTIEEFQNMVVNWLEDDDTATKIVEKGQTIYGETIKGFESLGPDTAPILQLTTDLARLEYASVLSQYKN